MPSGNLLCITLHVWGFNINSIRESFFSDLCDDDNYNFNIGDRPYKIQLLIGGDPETIDPDTSCASNGPDRCNVTTVTVADKSVFTEPDREDPCDPEISFPDVTSEEDKHKDARVFNQTEHMFKYIVGLISDIDQGGPHFRLVKLLRQSFKILENFCDAAFVSHNFVADVLNAFMFLLRDSDLSSFQDVGVEDYKLVMDTLLQCEQTPKTHFSLQGKKCKTCSSIDRIEKHGQITDYVEDDFSFMWGRYDLPVDATWGVLSFVHGLCFGTFQLNLNYHHLFQRVTEKLFTPEILYRWERPPQLHFEDIWDNMFSSPVKSTMKNLDVCIYAAYHKTPFLHRLERPLPKESATLGGAGSVDRPKRKKRSLPAMSLEQGTSLLGTGWCFQSNEDLLATATAYVELNCPDVRNPLTELKKVYEERTDETTYVDLPPDSAQGRSEDQKNNLEEDLQYTTASDYDTYSL